MAVDLYGSILRELSLTICLIVIIFLAEGIYAGEYRIAHCFQGCPEGASNENHLIIRPIYALSYNTSTKAADWVSYRITMHSIGIASSLPRQPILDNFVADTLQPSDFEGAAEIGLDRSLFVPLVNFAGTPFWNDVNYLTNAVARSRNLSQGAWYGLEWSVRNLVNREGDVFIIAGPVYKSVQESPQLHTTKQHRVPDAFFKIVVTADGRSTAFLFDQNLPVHVHHCDLRSSIAEIGDVTGLSFFPEMTRLNMDPLDSSLGCD